MSLEADRALKQKNAGRGAFDYAFFNSGNAPLIMFHIRLLVLLAALMPAISLAAGDDGEADRAAEMESGDGEADAESAAADSAAAGAIYIPLKPAMVVNYGGAGRLKYIKADLSVRVASVATADSIRHHMPYIRNNLIMLFSAQTDETISSQSGKEALRKESLREIREIIKKEDDMEGVIDLYFNSFILQK